MHKLHVLLVAVRSNSWVRGELDACGGGHINASSDELETGLQKRSAQVRNGMVLIHTCCRALPT